MKIIQLVSSVCLLSAPVSLTACNNDTPAGSLTVQFQIGSGVECSVNDVGDVTVSLYRPVAAGQPLGEPLYTEVAACSEGQVTFETLNAGTYTVVAEGVDSDNIVVVDSGKSTDTDRAEVLEGQDITLNEPIRMTVTPVKVELRWSFDGFDFNQCTMVKMKTLSVDAYSDGGADPLGTGGTFACDTASDQPDGYRLLVDEDRALKGSLLNNIEITPRDATGTKVGDPVVFDFPVQGPGRTIKLSVKIACTADECNLACDASPCALD